MNRRIVALMLALMLALSALSAFAETAEVAEEAAVEATEEIAEAVADVEEAVEALEEAEAEAEEALDELPLDTVLAVVNGEDVTWADVQGLLTDLISTYSQQGVDFTNEANLQQAREIAMDYAINYALLRQEAARLGLDQITEEDEAQLVADNDATWESAISSYITYALNLTDEASDDEKAAARASAIAYYEAQGYTVENTLAAARENLLYERVMAEMSKDVEVTDEMVQAEFNADVEADKEQYEGNIPMYEYLTQYYGQESYYQPEGYRGVIHILLTVDDELLQNYLSLSAKLEEQAEQVENGTSTEGEETTEGEEAAEPVTQEQVDEAEAAVIASVQATIDEIMAKFEAGEDIYNLIDEYGNDPGMKSEPYRSEGYSVHQDSIVWDPAFIKGAFAVEKVGELSKPVVGNYGVHLVYYLRDVPAGAVELTEELKAELREALVETAESDAINDGMEALIGAADISFTEIGEAFHRTVEEEPVAEDADDTVNP